MQRLFSMFPNGWPGKGLLILRLVAGIALIRDGVVALTCLPQREPPTLLLISATAGLFLLVGLLTPVAGVIVAGAQLLLSISGPEHIRNTIFLATFGVCIAMLGPGNWSVDALLFGRRRLDLHRR